MELAHLSVEECKTDKDEDDMGAEDLEGGLSKRKEGFDLNEADDCFAKPVDDAGEGKEIQHPHGT